MYVSAAFVIQRQNIFSEAEKLRTKLILLFQKNLSAKKTMTMRPVDFPLIHSSSTLASVSVFYLEIVETFRDGLFVGHQPV